MIEAFKRLAIGLLILGCFMLVLAYPNLAGPPIAILVIGAFAYVLGDFFITKDSGDDISG
jgi:hypothetical protein